MVFSLQQYSGEGGDRGTIEWDHDTEWIIKTVGAFNKLVGRKTVVLITSPGPVNVPFKHMVDTVLIDFMPGEKVASALFNILFGISSPSGKLTLSLPKSDNDYKFANRQFPGVDKQAEYTEQLKTGYRYYDSYNQEPDYPFGHGMTYTTFGYSNLKINDRTVEIDITNSGKREGKEVA